jgi:hypothetical protein
METFRLVIKIACAVMALVNLVAMCKAKTDGDTNDIITNGIWAIIMLLIYKL